MCKMMPVLRTGDTEIYIYIHIYKDWLWVFHWSTCSVLQKGWHKMQPVDGITESLLADISHRDVNKCLFHVTLTSLLKMCQVGAGCCFMETECESQISSSTNVNFNKENNKVKNMWDIKQKKGCLSRCGKCCYYHDRCCYCLYYVLAVLSFILRDRWKHDCFIDLSLEHSYSVGE